MELITSPLLDSPLWGAGSGTRVGYLDMKTRI